MIFIALFELFFFAVTSDSERSFTFLELSLKTSLQTVTHCFLLSINSCSFFFNRSNIPDMDLETENRIAAILLREAAELRRQAEKEGVRAYLQKPNVRHRPNSRFLTATVLGVQQANKAVEVNEMWKLRNKELELDERLKGKSREESRSGQNVPCTSHTTITLGKRCSSFEENVTSSSSSSRSTSKRWHSEIYDGLKNEDVENFLQSRVKRGRGSVGSRMDETGPYLPASADAITEQASRNHDTEKWPAVLGPERSSSLRQDFDSSSEEEFHERSRKKPKDHAETSKKKHSNKHKSKDKKRDHKKKRKEHKRRKQDKS